VVVQGLNNHHKPFYEGVNNRYMNREKILADIRHYRMLASQFSRSSNSFSGADNTQDAMLFIGYSDLFQEHAEKAEQLETLLKYCD
jgi:hypothetical protein